MELPYQKPLSGKNVGVVFGSFAPLHQGHLDLIMRAKKENDGGVIVICCGYDGDKGEPLMSHKKRYRYVREFFNDDDLVAVYAINDSELGIAKYPDGWNGWMEEFERIFGIAVEGIEHYVCSDPYVTKKHITYPHRRWYVGDESYYNDLDEMLEDVVLVDRVATNPICATMIRKNPIEHWNKITAPFRRIFSHNILICGTASEGKSTLTQDCGKYFNAPCSYEWAKKYIIESCISETELDAADFMAFLQGQYDLNKELINSPANNGVFFADTDAMVTRMYAEYYANDPNFDMSMDDFDLIAATADRITKNSRWDKIFLLSPAGKFVDDHERYMGHSELEQRNELYEILCNNIKRCGLWDKVTILNGGSYYENFLTITDYVKEVMAR